MRHRPKTAWRLARRRSPAGERGTPGQAAADRLHQHEIAALETPVADRDVERQRNRGRRGVGVPVDGRDHAIAPADPACARRRRGCGCSPGAAPPVDIADARGRWRRPPRAATAARLATAWRNTSLPDIRTQPTRAASPKVHRRHRECRDSDRRSADGSTGFRAAWLPPAAEPARRRRHRRHATAGAGAVAEQHARAAIVPIEDAREGLGADHQRRAAPGRP